jgi:hypothetical protein
LMDNATYPDKSLWFIATFYPIENGVKVLLRFTVSMALWEEDYTCMYAR